MAANNHTMFDSTTEEWRDIPRYEGVYQASSLGRIRSLTRIDRFGRTHYGRILAQSFNKRWGRWQCSLRKDGKSHTFRVSNLVAITFFGYPPPGLEADHKDGNKLNDCADNLEYVTHHENILRANAMGLINKRGEKHHSAKLTRYDVEQIRLLSKQGVTGIELSERFGVHRSQISRIINRKRWIS